MSDKLAIRNIIRTRLADTLRENAAWAVPMQDDAEQRIADVMLSLPGIAVITRYDLNQLLAVAELYVNAFSEDETMTLAQRLRLQVVEDILENKTEL